MLRAQLCPEGLAGRGEYILPLQVLPHCSNSVTQLVLEIEAGPVKACLLFEMYEWQKPLPREVI